MFSVFVVMFSPLGGIFSVMYFMFSVFGHKKSLLGGYFAKKGFFVP